MNRPDLPVDHLRFSSTTEALRWLLDAITGEGGPVEVACEPDSWDAPHYRDASGVGFDLRPVVDEATLCELWELVERESR